MEPDKVMAGSDAKGAAKFNDVFNPAFYDKLIQKEKGNLIMSSFSLQSVMGPVFLGAKGDTASQIKKGLSFPAKESLVKDLNSAFASIDTTGQHEVVSKAANRIYIKKGTKLSDDFIKDSNAVKEGMVEEITFSENEKAAKTINGWVEKQTNSKIKGLFTKDDFGGSTELVLVNALYFKGKWLNKFRKAGTANQKFHVTTSKTVEVPMMRNQGQYSVTILEDLKAKALPLPYTGESFHMVIILPDEKNGLDAVEQRLPKFDFAKGFEFSRPMGYQVSVPKFKIESTFELKETMESLGVQDIFVQGKADLSGISDNANNLHVSRIVQKAFVEANEEGSEAAGTTAVVVTKSRPQTFVCDHPFIFFIKDSKTGLILFMGRVVDPSE